MRLVAPLPAQGGTGAHGRVAVHAEQEVEALRPAVGRSVCGWPLPEALEEDKLHNRRFAETLAAGAALPADLEEMVLVAAGPFRMGTEQGAGDERPERTVFVSAFHIDRLGRDPAQGELFPAIRPTRKWPLLSLLYVEGARYISCNRLSFSRSSFEASLPVLIVSIHLPRPRRDPPPPDARRRGHYRA